MVFTQQRLVGLLIHPRSLTIQFPHCLPSRQSPPITIQQTSLFPFASLHLRKRITFEYTGLSLACLGGSLSIFSRGLRQ